MNGTSVLVQKELVLLGGGHSHVALLKSFGMRPLPRVRITLICKDTATPYSGMLPGLIAGHYRFDEAHLELRPLCNFAGAQFYRDGATGLDLPNKRVLCASHPPVRFDFLSINTGSTPRWSGVPGAEEHTLPVKPIERFLRGWDEIIETVLASPERGWRFAVVGGGAGGVELLLAARHRLAKQLSERGRSAHDLVFHLVTDSASILPTHNPRVRSKFVRILNERRVQMHVNARVVEVKPEALVCHTGKVVPFDFAFWVTSASAPSWVAESGLQTDGDGFIALNDCLQSVSHPFVFAAGDISAVVNHPRPKSGVFAVRQGPPLTANLRLALAGKPLNPFRPQKNFLSLISTGDQYAVASRRWYALEGRWVWRLKNWIDRRWMRKYQNLPAMKTASLSAIPAGLAEPESNKEILVPSMRCGGCGAKVGSTSLTRVLRQLTPVQRDDVLVGLSSLDDAAVTIVPRGQANVQTVDFFRSFINDPFVFGRVAANHSLNDIFAMGAEPQSALAIAVVPFGAAESVEEQLYQMMAGAMKVLNENRTALIGGHTSEGAELAFGLVVNGMANPNQLLRKAGMRPGDQLILTKPLGTGTLFAADMRRRAKGVWICDAVASMLQSNRDAAQCLLLHNATACTDVTGFGLLGHLMEMARPSKVDVELVFGAVPVLDGAAETIRAGMVSSLHAQNLDLQHAVLNLDEVKREERFPILLDPQTAGGLLASVPASDAQRCLCELKKIGYTKAALIGSVLARRDSSTHVTVKM